MQMLAPAYQLSARGPIAPAHQLSALDHSQVIGDQTFLSERLSESLFIGQPLQRLRRQPPPTRSRPEPLKVSDPGRRRRRKFQNLGIPKPI